MNKNKQEIKRTKVMCLAHKYIYVETKIDKSQKTCCVILYMWEKSHNKA